MKRQKGFNEKYKDYEIASQPIFPNTSPLPSNIMIEGIKKQIPNVKEIFEVEETTGLVGNKKTPTRIRVKRFAFKR